MITEDSAATSQELGDFTANWRMVPISILAIAIGVLAAYVAYALLQLIGLFTNLFFFHRWSTQLTSPAANTLGVLAVGIPIVGALIVGLIARFGSERIRGHGIPEALEAILIRGSRVEPRVALLKPVSAAVSIGSGGPFGAEGPIIMTGGALGSLVAQFFHLTSAERKTLLVAGAAAGMSATFAAPISSVLIAVELLLFEFKPRSIIPVALASATAMLARHTLLGSGPLFPVSAAPAFIGLSGLAGCVLIGLLAGGLSALMTWSVYTAEDLFQRLPIHWMWWPMIGGAVVGLGGLIDPRALGVGYDTIGSLLHGSIPPLEVLLLIVVKWLIWAIALGSGTSGGVLAPLLMIGSALGGLVGLLLPGGGPGFWALVAMGAILGGTMRSPLTGVVFAVELTAQQTMLLPLLVATMVSYGFTVLVMRRSILTEKVARRGLHLSREYGVDPLETLLVRDVCEQEAVVFPAGAHRDDIQSILLNPAYKRVALFPVVDHTASLLGVLTRRESELWVSGQGTHAASGTLAGIALRPPVIARVNEPLRAALHHMARSGRTCLPVVDDSGHFVGMLSLDHTLAASRRQLREEHGRDRHLTLPSHIMAIFRALRPLFLFGRSRSD